MKKMKLVVVGNGMAGVRAVEELLKIAPELYDITVFGAEPHPNYNRILLSPVLPVEQKEVLLLVALEDMAYADVAQALGIPIGTVMSRLSRGRERLRGLMEGRAEPVRLKVVK